MSKDIHNQNHTQTRGRATSTRTATATFTTGLTLALCIYICTATATAALAHTTTYTTPDERWPAERGTLQNHVQLTFPERFIKAGEAYFSPDDRRIIFQAIEHPDDDQQPPEDIYAMYIADVVYTQDDPRQAIEGLTNILRLSPPGSANTCGWFHPTNPHVVYFGSTMTAPSESTPPGYHRATGRYRWMFPPEMRIFELSLSALMASQPDAFRNAMKLVVGDLKHYQAEGAFSRDGRYMVYTSLETGQGDIYIHDTKLGESTLVIAASGYDGGPFFSPDGQRICYRSDRAGNNLLQIYVAEIAFDEQTGRVLGLQREFQLTDNQHVNWCPFWHPDGRHLVYATSEAEANHSNYEVFIIDADAGDGSSAGKPARYGTKKRRVTFADRFDGLPVFNSTGSRMMWTSQRNDDGSSQLWVADFIMDIDSPDRTTITPAAESTKIAIEDTDNGVIYIYDRTNHSVSRYDMATHALTPVTDPQEIQRIMELHRANRPTGQR